MLNLLIPLSLIGLSLTIIIKKIKVEPNNVLTPLIWFLLAVTVYFGFAPLIYELGNQASIDYLQRFYFIDKNDLLKTNYLNLVGVISAITSYHFCQKINLRKTRFENYRFNNLYLNTIFFTLYLGSFLLIFIQDCFKLNFGQLPWMFFELQYSILLISIFLIKKNKKINIIATLIIIIILIVNLFTLYKLKIIQCIIIITIGIYLRSKNIKYALVCLFLTVLIFIYLDRVISELRDIGYGNKIQHQNICLINKNIDGIDKNKLEKQTIVENFSNSKTSSDPINDLLNTLGSTFRFYSKGDYRENIYYPLIRFVMVPNQVYVMALYDSGRSAQSLNAVLWMPIPRVVYPHKPIMHPLANFQDDRYDLILNSGYFAEGYWNYGWIGVIFISIILGIYLKLGEILAFYILKNKIYFLLPLVINTIVTIHRVEDWFTMNIIASLFKIAYLFLIFLIINKLFLANKNNKI